MTIWFPLEAGVSPEFPPEVSFRVSPRILPGFHLEAGVPPEIPPELSYEVSPKISLGVSLEFQTVFSLKFHPGVNRKLYLQVHLKFHWGSWIFTKLSLIKLILRQIRSLKKYFEVETLLKLLNFQFQQRRMAHRATIAKEISSGCRTFHVTTFPRIQFITVMRSSFPN